MLLNLYKTYIKDKLIVPTQKSTTTKDEIEIYDNLNNKELYEDALNNCFTLTQSRNEDGLIFTERINESLVYYFVIEMYIHIDIIACSIYCIFLKRATHIQLKLSNSTTLLSFVIFNLF